MNKENVIQSIIQPERRRKPCHLQKIDGTGDYHVKGNKPYKE
jgi:hypothetical protein